MIRRFINQTRLCKNHKLYKSENFIRVLYDSLGIVGKTPTPVETLEKTFEWIKASFNVTGDGGSSAYYTMGSGWKSSYPETTGYLIPTIYDYSDFTGNKEWRKIAKRAADWLISIQHEEGGWQGLQIGVKCGLRVFNSAMILDGLVAAYRKEKDAKYLNAAVKGAKWLVNKMDANGLFTKDNVDEGGSFDILALACALMVFQFIDKENRDGYVRKIRKSLDAHLRLKEKNGWFRKCNFSNSYKDTMLLHHLGYTLDGLIISSEILDDIIYYEAVKRSANQLLSIFEMNMKLPAYIKTDWSAYLDINGKRYSSCLTGCSQTAIVFQKIYSKEKDLRFLNAALKINDMVGSIGNMKYTEKGICYGLSGSYPVYGNYQTCQFVNWAAKYHAESVLFSLDSCMNKKV